MGSNGGWRILRAGVSQGGLVISLCKSPRVGPWSQDEAHRDLPDRLKAAGSGVGGSIADRYRKPSRGNRPNRWALRVTDQTWKSCRELGRRLIPPGDATGMNLLRIKASDRGARLENDSNLGEQFGTGIGGGRPRSTARVHRGPRRRGKRDETRPILVATKAMR